MDHLFIVHHTRAVGKGGRERGPAALAEDQGGKRDKERKKDDR